MKLLFSFLPWIVFLILKSYAGETAALTVSIIISIIFDHKRLRQGFYVSWIIILSMLVLLSCYLFGKFEVTPLIRTLLMSGSFAVMAWISLIISKPFTIQYAKEEVPEDKWSTPGFIKVNQIITLVWALAMSANTAASIFHYHSDTVSIVTIVLAIMFTKRYPQYYRQKFIKNMES